MRPDGKKRRRKDRAAADLEHGQALPENIGNLHILSPPFDFLTACRAGLYFLVIINLVTVIVERLSVDLKV